MVQVNTDLTRRVASLARLSLTEAEIETFTPQLGEILQYVEKLGELDTKEVEPLAHPFDLGTLLREDKVNPWPLDEVGKPKVLKSAPEKLYDGFKVPSIL